MKNHTLRAAALIEEFRKIDETISTPRIAIFLHIANNEGCSAVDLIKAVSVAQTSVVKNVKVLESLGLVKSELVRDPHGRLRFYLGRMGNVLVGSINRIMEGN